MNPIIVEHSVVWRDPGYFAAWPANGAMWQFEDGEIALCFIRAECDYSSEKSVSHTAVVRERVIVRSYDGGHTWDADNLTSLPFGYSDHRSGLWALGSPKNPTDKLAPNSDGFCLMPRFGLPPMDAQHLAGVCISQNRGHTWCGPYTLPAHDYRHIGKPMRHVVLDDGTILLFAYASRSVSNSIGLLPDVSSFIVVYSSSDGGASWNLLSEIKPAPAEPSAIMPYPLILDDGTIVAAVRRPHDGVRMYTQIYASEGEGNSWELRSRISGWGAPACLTALPNGDVLCTYSYRNGPYGIRGTVSRDGCRTWAVPFWIRDDGGSMDLGYPLTVVRPDGALLTTYYFNTADDPIQMNGGVRHIAATVWKLA